MLAALVGAGWGIVAGVVVPELIGRLPEPAPQPEREGVTLPPKPLYADLAALPGLRWRAAAAGLVIGALLGLGVRWEPALLVVLGVLPFALALAVVDWHAHLLPTRLILPAYVVTAALVLVAAAIDHDLEPVLRAAAGGAASLAIFAALWLIAPGSMGFGDVRLSGVLGLAMGYVGWTPLWVGLWLMFALGFVGGVLLRLLRRTGRGHPFGPFMLLGALVGVVLLA